MCQIAKTWLEDGSTLIRCCSMGATSGAALATGICAHDVPTCNAASWLLTLFQFQALSSIFGYGFSRPGSENMSHMFQIILHTMFNTPCQ